MSERWAESIEMPFGWRVVLTDFGYHITLPDLSEIDVPYEPGNEPLRQFIRSRAN